MQRLGIAVLSWLAMLAVCNAAEPERAKGLSVHMLPDWARRSITRPMASASKVLMGLAQLILMRFSWWHFSKGYR